MNKSNLLGLLLVALFTVHQSYAQITEPDCKDKVTVAKAYMDYIDFLSPELKQEILEEITPCVASGNSDAVYVASILTLEGNPTEIEEQNAFSNIEQVAQNGGIEAARSLGILYKNGTGTEINLDESLYWLKKAADAGDDIGKYGVGYYQLKGLGTANQSYQNALQSLQSSNYPMSKHWEAICHYFGYGVPVNEDLALQILKENNIENSILLKLQFQVEYENPNQPPSVNPSITNDEKNILARHNEDSEVLTTDDISFVYQGKFVEYDWSKTYFNRTLPFDLTLEYNHDTNKLDYSFKIDGATQLGTANYEDNTATLDKKIVIPVKRLIQDHPEIDSITYEISSLQFDLVTPANATDPVYVIGDVTGDIPEWKEPMMPARFLLKQLHKPGEPPTPPAADLEDLVVSPNPTTGQTKAIFTLNTPMAVSLEVRNVTGALFFSSNRTSFPIGSHSIDILLPFAPSGSYYMTLFAGNQRYTETIIKN